MNFWKGRKVLITGHTGFKGSWLSLWLQELGADLSGVALAPSSSPSLFNLLKLDQGMQSHIVDVRDYSGLFRCLKEEQPEIIFHMAAQALVRVSYQAPIETYATNVLGTVHVLEAARQLQTVKAIVNITTDKCYENQEWPWAYRETDRLGGHDPYSNSKACAELVTEAYRASYFKENGIGLASARAGNVIGGGDWAEDRLVPDIVRACMQGEEVAIRSPQAIRPWQHVLEPLSAYLLLAENLYRASSSFAKAWNFGPNEEDAKPVSWIAEFITNEWQQGASWRTDETKHPHEAKYLKLECSQAKTLLGWQPRWNLERGLKETIAWYKAYQSSENMRQKTLEQILNFIEA